MSYTIIIPDVDLETTASIVLELVDKHDLAAFAIDEDFSSILERLKEEHADQNRRFLPSEH